MPIHFGQNFKAFYFKHLEVLNLWIKAYNYTNYRIYIRYAIQGKSFIGKFNIIIRQSRKMKFLTIKRPKQIRPANHFARRL